ncbi:MAG: thioredoxin domain-containing protein, partial [Chlamydiae bacterium]|nr:thioredoxin domain-containing protein [Chlamydiota bacterium]
MHVGELWGGAQREKVLFQAQELIDMFEETFSVFETSSTMPSSKLITHGAEAFFRAADFVYGGKKGAPKFPMSYHLDFLLEYGHLNEDIVAETYVDLSLDMMSRGGIYDHIGGGFSRYCVDEKWFVPHFEKMLSDNAMLSYSYLLGYKFLSKPQYRIICEETLDFLMREMLSPEDLFFSAQDADSEGKEGEFYTWSYQEIKEVLTPFESELFFEFYNVLEEGNFEGKNILFQHLSFEEFANLKQIPLDKLTTIMKDVRKKLLAQRIKSFLFAGFAFSNPIYILVAQKSMRSLLEKVYQEGRLYHRYKENEVKYHGNLEDYSLMIDLLFSFFEFGFGRKYLIIALKLLEDALTLFQSSEGGFYFSLDQGESLLFRRCEFNDGAEPASNSLFA